VIDEARQVVGMEPDEFYRKLAPIPGQARWSHLEDWVSEKYKGQYRERKLRELNKLKEHLKLEYEIIKILGGGP
jgi:hypothetical protein